MNTISIVRIATLAAMLLCSAGWAQEHNPRSADYEQFLASAHRLFKGGQLPDAGQAAATLIMRDSNRYEGYVLAAKVAMFQGQTNPAIGFAQTALQLAPTERKDPIKQFISDLSRGAGSTTAERPSPLEQEFRAHLKAAEQATADGLQFKALREFTAAFTASPPHAEIGLKAAKLWLDRGEVMEAVRVINLMRTQKLDPGVEAEANQILDDHESALARIFREQSAAGWALLDQGNTGFRELTNAAAHFKEAIEARYRVKPESGSPLDAGRSPYMGLALTDAALDHVTNAITTLKLAAKAGLRVDGNYFVSGLWKPVIKDRAFQQFLREAFGDQLPEEAAAAATGTLKDFAGEWEFLPDGPRQTADYTCYKKGINLGISEDGSLVLTRYQLTDISACQNNEHFYAEMDYPAGTCRGGLLDGSLSQLITTYNYRYSFEMRYFPAQNMLKVVKHTTVVYSSLASKAEEIANLIRTSLSVAGAKPLPVEQLPSSSLPLVPDETTFLALDSSKTKLVELCGVTQKQITDTLIASLAGRFPLSAVKVARD